MKDGAGQHRLDVGHFLSTFVVMASRCGIETSAGELRRGYALPEGLMAFEVASGMARELGIHLQALHVGWDAITELRGAFPAMLMVRDGSFLVAEGLVEDTPQGPVLLARDPGASGGDVDIALDRQRFERLCSGDFILLKRHYHLADTLQPFSMRWIVSQLLLERPLLRDIGIASFVMTFLSLFPPILTMIVMDRVLVNHSYSTLGVMCGAVGFLILCEMLTGYTRRLFMEVMATRIDGRLSLYLLDRLLGLPLEFFEHNPTGLIQSKLSKIYQIRSFLTGKLLQTALDMVVVAIVGADPVRAELGADAGDPVAGGGAGADRLFLRRPGGRAVQGGGRVRAAQEHASGGEHLRDQDDQVAGAGGAQAQRVGSVRRARGRGAAPARAHRQHAADIVGAVRAADLRGRVPARRLSDAGGARQLPARRADGVHHAGQPRDAADHPAGAADAGLRRHPRVDPRGRLGGERDARTDPDRHRGCASRSRAISPLPM
jgi:hypothetical protein